MSAEEQATPESESPLPQMIAVATLIEKARALVDLLEDAENNHGGLIGTKTLRAKNVLRLELSRWP